MENVSIHLINGQTDMGRAFVSPQQGACSEKARPLFLFSILT